MGDTIVLGGLGGGGDVGLALIIADEYGLWDSIAVFASFSSCRHLPSGSHVRFEGKALARVYPASGRSSPRFFEDKLATLLQAWGFDIPVYVICRRGWAWRTVFEAAKRVAVEHGASCWVAGDIGGDGLVLGYERGFGSYVTDTVARSVLAALSRDTGVRTVLSVAAAGAEGGGSALDVRELAAALLYLYSKGVVLGTVVPRVESLEKARALLSMGASGMLALYLESFTGKQAATLNTAYLRGVYRLEPWYRYVWFLDLEGHCRLSPICTAALERGEAGIRGWRSVEPPPSLAEIVRGLRDPAASILGLARLLNDRWSLAGGCR